MVNKLKRKIISKGLKQVWLANELEIHEVDMSRYVNGATYPKKETRYRIANFFNVNMDELFPSPPKRKPRRKLKRKLKLKLKRKLKPKLKRKPIVKAVIPIPEGYIKI